MKTKILIVDDHPAIRTTMADVMINEGFEVHVAECGKQAIELYSEDTFNFVLMDMQMKDMKGVDVFRKMLKLERKQANFVFISAFSAPELENEAYELGCMAFLQKPIRVERVIDLIRSKSRKSVLVFLENEELLQNVTEELKKECFSIDSVTKFDQALIKLRQINYNYVIVDEDSPGIEQDRIENTLKVTKSESHFITINEDESPALVISRIQSRDYSKYLI
mgnify:FL=1